MSVTIIDPFLGVKAYHLPCRLAIPPPSPKVVTLVMAWRLKAAEMGYFARKEFLDGFKDLGYVLLVLL